MLTRDNFSIYNFGDTFKVTITVGLEDIEWNKNGSPRLLIFSIGDGVFEVPYTVKFNEILAKNNRKYTKYNKEK